MSSPTSTPPLQFVPDPSSASTTKKRPLAYVDEKERLDKMPKTQGSEMPIMELPKNEVVRNPRQIPAFVLIGRRESPQSSKGSSTGSDDLRILEYAVLYLEERRIPIK